jgi:hypothetical protein
MEHKSIALEQDENLINKILDDIDMRYIILFMYIIRNDLFDDLNDENLIESYERVLILDEVYKDNVTQFWDTEFIDVAIDLGLFKNVRSFREFEQKDGDFLLKLGEETITIENNVISIPDDTLFLMINKKFKSLTRRNFNSALMRLKGVSCEVSSMIHPIIYKIGDHDYALSDDLYYILDQFGNIYQAIKIELTIEGFTSRFNEIQEKIDDFIGIFDPKLNSKPARRKIHEAIEKDKDIIKYLKDEKIELSDKFNFDEINREELIFQQWISKLNFLIRTRNNLNDIENKLVELKNNYSGKKKKYPYLKFIEKISFNEDNIVNNIQEKLLYLRNEVVEINEKMSEITKKELKLLNLDYERLIITSSD